MVRDQLPKKAPMLLAKEKVGDRIKAIKAEYSSLWGMPSLTGSVIVQFSDRLRSTLGRTSVEIGRIRLSTLLLSEGAQLLDEVLCHELAHIVVHKRFGKSGKPHGREWAALMKQAGFEPRLRISFGNKEPLSSTVRFEHLCPVCQTIRLAKRSIPNLRCKSCVEAGLEGHLLIKRINKK